MQLKKVFPAIILCNLIALSLRAQNVDLSGLKTPNSPGFQILDISPSSIERPTNPKAFAFSLFNLSNAGTALPKNFAFEISPFWYFKPKNATVYKYLNIRDKEHQNTFTGIYNKLSISIASSYSDSTAGSLLKKTNYLAFGASTNLITLRSPEQHRQLNENLRAISQRISSLSSDITRDKKRNLKARLVELFKENRETENQSEKQQIENEIKVVEAAIDSLDKAKPEELEMAISKDAKIREYLKSLSQVPLFQLNLAYAYSAAVPGNTYKNRRFNRSGVWLNATLSSFSFNPQKLQDNLSMSGSVKYINDNVLADSATNRFEKEKAFDFGGRIEYSLREFSLSVEHLKRSYSSSNLKSARTVAVVQYKISDNLYLAGSFGKNFGDLNNVFALFGLNWGFGRSSLVPNSQE